MNRWLRPVLLLPLVLILGCPKDYEATAVEEIETCAARIESYAPEARTPEAGRSLSEARMALQTASRTLGEFKILEWSGDHPQGDRDDQYADKVGAAEYEVFTSVKRLSEKTDALQRAVHSQN